MTTSVKDKRHYLKVAILEGQNTPFTPNDADVLYWWNIINEVLFAGELQEPARLIYKRFHKELGWCVPFRFNNKINRRVRIGIHSMLHNLYDFLCVLVHEMIHQWEWEHLGSWDDKVSHGSDFYSWRDAVTELGLPLHRSYDIGTGPQAA